MHAHEQLLSSRRATAKPRSTVFQKARDDACGLVLCGPMKRSALGIGRFLSARLVLGFSSGRQRPPMDGLMSVIRSLGPLQPSGTLSWDSGLDPLPSYVDQPNPSEHDENRKTDHGDGPFSC